MMVVMSSSDSFLRMVLLPALSRPSTRMRACAQEHTEEAWVWACNQTASARVTAVGVLLVAAAHTTALLLLQTAR